MILGLRMGMISMGCDVAAAEMVAILKQSKALIPALKCGVVGELIMMS